jgi:lipopolysaccharide heptosyltransferase I
MASNPPARPRAYQRILIIKPSSLGDIIHALPVLAALRAAYPRAHVAWLAATQFVPLLEGHPMIDEVIGFDRQRFGRMHRSVDVLRDFAHFVAYTRRHRFDLVIDLQGLFRSGFLAWASGARRRYGFATARELAPLFYTHRVCCPRRARHAVDRNVCIATALGLPITTPQFPLGLRADEVHAARRLLAQAAGAAVPRFTAVLPGARWASKLWRVDYLAQVIDRLSAETGSPTVLLGAGAERPRADQITARCTSEVIDLVGRTGLRQLVALLALAQSVLSQDSGPMHIAAALGRPLLAIFGPTDPARTGPYSPAARVVSLPLPCAPCLRRTCPRAHHHCMEQLTPEHVLAQVRELAAGPRRER